MIRNDNPKGNQMNNLDKIFAAMRTGKYGTVVDPKGKIYVGIINSVMREDGSGRKWIVTITHQTTSHNVFVYAY
jgi:hypothetical protein